VFARDLSLARALGRALARVHDPLAARVTPLAWGWTAVVGILGGALSNGVDRLVQGSVVDFIKVGWWPVFNVADSCIVVAIVLLLLFSFRPSSRPSSARS